MNDLKRKLIVEAKKKYSRIFPCSSRRNFNECFTVEEDQIIFWFNTEDSTTHTLSADIAAL